MIINAKGQYYAVECETLEENNRVFDILGGRRLSTYLNYATTDDKAYNVTSNFTTNYQIVPFKYWIKLTEQPIMITIPIKDYNRLRKLEIKQEIKKLKKELKGL